MITRQRIENAAYATRCINQYLNGNHMEVLSNQEINEVSGADGVSQVVTAGTAAGSGAIGATIGAARLGGSLGAAGGAVGAVIGVVIAVSACVIYFNFIHTPPPPPAPPAPQP